VSRKYVTQPGADQLATWKNALSAHKRQARRGKHRAPKVTGIRVAQRDVPGRQSAGAAQKGTT